MFIILNFNIFSERGSRSSSRSSRGSSMNSRVRVGHGVGANGVSKNAGKTSLAEQIDLLSKIIKFLLNSILYIFVIVFGSIFNIFSGNKKIKNDIKKNEKIEIISTNDKLLKLDKLNKKRLNFAGIDKDTYNVMNSYIINGFETERLKVNFTTDEDIEKLGKYFEDIDMFKYTTNKEINDEESGVKYLKECNKKLESYYFCIKIKETNEPIGQINIKFYEPGVMTMSYWIGKKFRRNGYMSEIGLKFTEDVFFNLKNINRLNIYMYKNNIGSKTYVEKLYKYLMSKHKCRYGSYEKKDDEETISTLFYILEKHE